mmetsp:Transcript_140271/g.244311  ORF Transcript_140271/g.244311 Transcript_140271/m.244311 type:complete len:128 (-) Transcript_140271:243-626(-)
MGPSVGLLHWAVVCLHTNVCTWYPGSCCWVFSGAPTSPLNKYPLAVPCLTLNCHLSSSPKPTIGHCPHSNAPHFPSFPSIYMPFFVHVRLAADAAQQGSQLRQRPKAKEPAFPVRAKSQRHATPPAQ